MVSRLALLGDASVETLDYTAVEYSRVALEAALRGAVQHGFDELSPAGGAAAAVGALARLRRPGAVETGLSLVESDANRFVDAAEGPFDVVILNELLDDLPCRLFYADADGGRHELAPYARPEGERWRVQLTEETAAGELPPDMPPGTLTSTSEESLRLVRGARRPARQRRHAPDPRLRLHGPLSRGTQQYAGPRSSGCRRSSSWSPPRRRPGVPKSFFRVYGNEAVHEVQITNDVNFAELTDLLEQSGMVFTLPHGNLLTSAREWPDFFFKGDGVFLSEFINLTADDDLPALLAELNERQAEFRDRYVNAFGGGRTAIFSDLVYIKA